MGPEFLFYIALIILVGIAGYLGLVEVFRIAKRKGLEPSKYVFMTLFFFPLGLACLIAAPDRPAQAED